MSRQGGGCGVLMSRQGGRCGGVGHRLIGWFLIMEFKWVMWRDGVHRISLDDSVEPCDDAGNGSIHMTQFIVQSVRLQCPIRDKYTRSA